MVTFSRWLFRMTFSRWLFRVTFSRWLFQGAFWVTFHFHFSFLISRDFWVTVKKIEPSKYRKHVRNAYRERAKAVKRKFQPKNIPKVILNSRQAPKNHFPSDTPPKIISRPKSPKKPLPVRQAPKNYFPSENPQKNISRPTRWKLLSSCGWHLVKLRRGRNLT